MDKQTQTLLITVGIAVVILYIARPKGNMFDSKSKDHKFAPPRKISKDVTKKNGDGQIIIEAMRNAINANEKQDEIDKLNAMFLDEYGMKVFFAKNGKLEAKTAEGKLIAQEA